jgi:hypothetical protein
MQHTEKMQKLIELVLLNPGVRSCIQRIICEVVPDSVTLSENGKPLTPDLQRLLGPWLSTFLQNSIEMACTKKRKRERPCLYRYSVRPLHPEVNEDDIFVYDFLPPALKHDNILPSPLDTLCSVRSIMDMTETKIEQVLHWNSTKHITTSERVTVPKDRTTEGVSLLDDFRRYLVTGQHLDMSKNYMTMNGLRVSLTENPMNLSSKIIHNQFANNEAANVHVLPPNTDVNELAGLELKTNLLELQDIMQRHVTEYFHMPMLADMAGKDIGDLYRDKISNKLRHMSNFCCRLTQFTYTAIYDIPEKNVEVDLPQPSGMHIHTADDVKKLHESNTLLPSDRLKIRKRMMHNV